MKQETEQEEKTVRDKVIVKNGNRSDRLIQTHAHGEGQQPAARGQGSLKQAKQEVSMIQKMCVICYREGSCEG